MNLSKQGEEFIQRWEGSVKNKQGLHVPYKDVAGLWTSGYGHLLTKSELSSGKIDIFTQLVDYRSGLTEAQVDIIFGSDVETAEYTVNYLVRTEVQQEFDALVSFVFNLGSNSFRNSTLLKKIVADAPPEEITFQFNRWVYAAGRVVKGLQRRRAAEARLYTTGQYT